MSKKVLLVDDEEDIIEFLEYNLKKESYEVYTASNGQEALDLALEVKPDLIVLDVMMPVLDGIETCRKMRSYPELETTLIVFLTAREEDYMQIEGLDSGGDDYINKPVRPRLFLKKVDALLRRTGSSDESIDIIKVDDLLINKEQYSVVKGTDSIFLPRKEFELFYLLVSKPGKVYTRVEILNKIWGEDVFVTDRTIDVHVRKLREKLGDSLIKTVKGVGYKFEFNGK